MRVMTRINQTELQKAIEGMEASLERKLAARRERPNDERLAQRIADNERYLEAARQLANLGPRVDYLREDEQMLIEMYPSIVW